MFSLIAIICIVLCMFIANNLSWEKMMAFKNLWVLNEYEVDSYLESYNKLYDPSSELQCNDLKDFENGVLIKGFKPADRAENTELLYKVLHNAIILGELDKMYIPPQLGESLSIKENQLLAEKKLSEFLQVKEGENLVELGCGSGAIAMSMSHFTKCKITGLNIDLATITKGIKKLNAKGISNINLKYQDFNDPLNLDDNSVDGIYEVQALTFSEDLPKVMEELFRVLKPGKRLALLEGCCLDLFNKQSDMSAKDMFEVRGVTAGGAIWHYKYFDKIAEDAGFRKILNASIGGTGRSKSGEINSYAPELPILKRTNENFKTLGDHLRIMAYWKLIPSHIPKIFDRVSLGGDTLVRLMENDMITTSRYMVYEKPTL